MFRDHGVVSCCPFLRFFKRMETGLDALNLVTLWMERDQRVGASNNHEWIPKRAEQAICDADFIEDVFCFHFYNWLIIYIFYAKWSVTISESFLVVIYIRVTSSISFKLKPYIQIFLGDSPRPTRLLDLLPVAPWLGVLREDLGCGFGFTALAITTVNRATEPKTGTHSNSLFINYLHVNIQR